MSAGAQIIVLHQRLAATQKDCPVPAIEAGEPKLSDNIIEVARHLAIAALKHRGNDPMSARMMAAYLWRMRVALERLSEDAERLERKYKKAKKKARGR